MADSEHVSRQIFEPEPWRVLILDWGSAAAGVFALAFGLVIGGQPVLTTAPAVAAMVIGSVSALVAVAIWRNGPYRLRVAILMAVCLSGQAFGLLRSGFVIGTTIIGLLGVVFCGLLLGVRWAIAAWALSALTMFGGALLVGSGLVASPFDPSLIDPRVLRTGIRQSLLYAGASAILAVGISVVVDRLARALAETRRALANEKAAQVERERAEAALAASEARWRSIVDHAPAYIAIVDRAHRIEFLNRPILSAEQSRVVGQEAESFVLPGARQAIREAIDRVFETGLDGTLESEVQLPDGRLRQISSRLGPLRVDGVVERVTVIATDVTEHWHLEEQLRQSQKLEAIGQLTGGVAHDFNNLLTVVLGNLELAASQLDSVGLSQEFVDQATDAAHRGAALTQRLLAFARKQALRPRSVDLGALVAGMDDLLRRTLGATIEIRSISEPGIWRCEVDAGQLENAILNLAINARDAMPEGGKLTIETANVELDPAYAAQEGDVVPGAYVMLAVSDTGIGMELETVHQAFDPFFTTKAKGTGTGLGLSMVYGLVKQSQGHVKIYSEPGQGTTVRLYLPRVTSVVEVVAAAASPQHAQGRGELILVVEDDEAVRRLTLRVLHSLGYRTLEAGDASRALELIRDTPGVELLLTDVILPGGRSGVDLARETKRIRPGLRVLYCSGYTENSILHHGRLDPGVELLEKPFSPGQLAARVRALLDAGAA